MHQLQHVMACIFYDKDSWHTKGLPVQDLLGEWLIICGSESGSRSDRGVKELPKHISSNNSRVMQRQQLSKAMAMMPDSIP